MQVQRLRSNIRPRRSGFTLIELLVVISIIAVLAALILPGIQNAREAARRAQCLSQMRNVSTALHSYATTNNGRLPYLVTDAANPSALQLDPDGDGATTANLPASWCVQLLPFLEQQGMFDRITSNPGALPASPDNAATLANTNIKVFTCPDDENSDSGGTLSFVVNGGYTTSGNWTTLGLNTVHFASGTYSFAFDGHSFPASSDDNDIMHATGVFFQEFNSGGYRGSLDRMNDGQSHTVMLTENLQATTWASPFIEEIAFVVPLAQVTSQPTQFEANATIINGVGAVSGGAKKDAMRHSGTGYNEYQFSSDATLKQAKINDTTGAGEGTRPRPSSLHPGVVNVAFADGSCRAIGQSIADAVWVRLVSASGERYGQSVLGDDSF